MGPKTASLPRHQLIATLRASLGLRCEEIAALIGAAPSEVRAWERGQSPIPLPVSMLLNLLLAAPSSRTIAPVDRAVLRRHAMSGRPRSSRVPANGHKADASEVLTAVLDAIPVMARWYDAAGNVRLMNREALARLGWSAEEARSIDVIDVCFPDPAERARVRAFIANPDGSWMDQEVTDRNGSRSHTSWTNVRLSDGSQIGLGIDVSERMEREAALRRSRAWLESIIDSSHDQIAAIDCDYRLIACNRAYKAEFERLFGRAVEVGDDFADSLAHLPCERAAAMHLWSQALAGEPFRIEQAFGDARRERKVFDLTFSPIRDAGGGVIGAVQILRDNTELVRARECLEESERAARQQLHELETLYRTAPIGLALFDRAMRCLRMNEKLAEINGHSVEEHLGRVVWDLVPELRAEAEPRFRQVFDTGERVAFELRGSTAKQPSVERDWLELLYPLEAVDGSVEAVGVICKEITERKHGEAAMRESEIRFRSTFENAAVGIGQLALDHGWLRVNQKLCDIVGYTRDELLGLSFIDITHPDDLPVNLERQNALVRGELAEYEIEKRYVRKNGSPVWVMVTVSLQRDVRGQPQYAIAVVQDIAARKQIEQRLRDSEGTFRMVVECAPDAVFLHDEAGRFLDVNRRACESLGYTRAELLTLGVADVEKDFTAEHLHDNFVRIGPGETARFIGRHRRKDGSTFPTEIHVGCYIGQGQKLLLGLARDITERKRMEDALRESEERFHLFVDKSPALTWMKSADGRLIYANKMCEDVLGLDLPVSLGKKDSDLWPPEVAEHFRRADLEALASRSFVRVTEAVKTGHGEERTFSTLKFPFTDIAGNRFVGGVALDITDMLQVEKLRESEELFRRMFDLSPVGAAMLSLDHRFLRVNAELVRITGYDEAELTACDFRAITHPDDIERDIAASARLCRGEIDTYSLEKRYICKDGSIAWIHKNVRLMRNSRGEPLYFLPILTDITDRKAFEDALFREKDRAEVTLHSIGDGVITTDAQGVVDYLNPVAATMTVWTPAEARGQSLATVFNTLDEGKRKTLPDLVAACLGEDGSIPLPTHTLLLDRYGREYAIEGSLAPLRARSGDVLGTVVVFRDVTQHRVLERKLEYDASHDPLTGLANRREFEQRLARAVASAREKRSEHAICFIDLDQFKVVNDSAGHAAGDALLKYVPTLLAGKIRERDTLARLGGDEFAVLLEHCPLRDAARIAQRIVAAFEDWRFAWEGRPYQVGASVGVVAVTEDAIDEGEVLAKADVACYAAKEAGRNRIHVYQTEGASSSSHHAQIKVAARLKEALEQDRFRLFCQPIVPLAAGTGSHPLRVEILIRLLDEENALVLPARFIPAAERYGLMPAIDRWVVRNAFVQYVERPCPQVPIEITINLSGVALGREDFHDFVLAQFAATGMPTERVCFEITETAAIQNFEQAMHFAEQIRSIGGRIALDDFGSGLSSFKYLRFLPTDYLKIDGAFVQNMLENSKDFAMVAAINGIGHELGLATVAEFVDKPEIIDCLRDLGVDYAQGYALGVPMPLEAAFSRAIVAG